MVDNFTSGGGARKAKVRNRREKGRRKGSSQWLGLNQEKRWGNRREYRKSKIHFIRFIIGLMVMDNSTQNKSNCSNFCVEVLIGVNPAVGLMI